MKTERYDKVSKEFFNKGYTLATEDVLKKIDDWALKSILKYDDDSIAQTKIIEDITRYVKKLKASLKNSQQLKKSKVDNGDKLHLPNVTDADTNNQDVCEKCGKRRDKHYFGNGYYWCSKLAKDRRKFKMKEVKGR